jgi:hypothetical protein
MTEVELTAAGSDRPADGDISTVLPAHLELLARRERSLWRLALLVLSALAVALALVSRGWLKDLPYNLEALPIGLVILVALFGNCAAWFAASSSAPSRPVRTASRLNNFFR